MNAPLPATRFHGRLSRDYHLLYPDWDEAITEQAAVLAAMIESSRGSEKCAVLDCACGIGTQALGLAARGYSVTGTDASPAAIKRATREARSRRLASARFTVADMRALPKAFQDSFDVVVGCDDPLAHLPRPQDLRIAFLGMRTALRSGGLLLLSSRDYDRILPERPREACFQHRWDGKKTTIVFQIWDWDADAPSYVSHQFILRSRFGGWKTLEACTRMRAYTHGEIAEGLEAAGFTSITWHTPEESGFFEPIVSAVSPS